MADQSNLVELAIDPPLDMSGGWRPSASDRRYIDNQMLAIEGHLLRSLLRGVVASWYIIAAPLELPGDEVDQTLGIGDAVCLASTTLGHLYVRKATEAALEDCGYRVLGICLTAGSEGAVLVALSGTLPPSVTGLEPDTGEPFVIINGMGRCISTGEVEEGDVQVGTMDIAGNMQLGAAGGSGGGGGGGGVAEPSVIWSPVTTLHVEDDTPTSVAGDKTTGCSFFLRYPGTPGVPVLISGLRFWWASNSNENVRTVLYNAAGLVIASAYVLTSGEGVYESAFAGSFQLPFQTPFTAAIYGGGITYTQIPNNTASALLTPARPFFGGPRVGWVNLGLWGAGDAAPTTTHASEWYMVEPIIVEG